MIEIRSGWLHGLVETQPCIRGQQVGCIKHGKNNPDKIFVKGAIQSLEFVRRANSSF